MVQPAAKRKSGIALSPATLPFTLSLVIPRDVIHAASLGEEHLVRNGSRLVFLNTFTGGIRQGTARIVSWERGIMRHCQIESPYENAAVHALKVHSGGPGMYDDNWLKSAGGDPAAPLGWKTSKVVVANNRFGGGRKNANWTIGFCPSNDGFGLDGAEPLEDVILEGNTFVRFPGWGGDNHDIVGDGRRITARNNSVESGEVVDVGRGHQQSPEYSGPCFLDDAVPYFWKSVPCFSRW